MGIIDELLMMTSEDIEFGSLSEDIIRQLALSEDPFIATEALGELSIRESSITTSIAWEILVNQNSDIYLQAAALEILFKVDYTHAINYLLERIETCAPYILNTVMELLIEYNLDLENDNNSRMISLILKRIKEIGNETPFPTREIRNSFKEIYTENIQ